MKSGCVPLIPITSQNGGKLKLRTLFIIRFLTPNQTRYLVLYQYGGLYTDIDAAPGRLFANGTVIKDDDDAWFVIEQIGTLSQYFMSSSPKHPLMYLAVITTLRRLLEIEQVGLQYVPYVTGPGALKEAYSFFTYESRNGDKEGVNVDGSQVNEGQERQSKNNTRRRIQSEFEAMAQMNNTSNVTMEQERLHATTEAGPSTVMQELAPVPPIRRGGIQEGVYVGMLGRTVTIGASRRVSGRDGDAKLHEF
jgi:hypothetical protein